MDHLLGPLPHLAYAFQNPHRWVVGSGRQLIYQEATVCPKEKVGEGASHIHT
jgi:hypothetical protein